MSLALLPRPVWALLALLEMGFIFHLSSLPPEALADRAPGPTGNLMHVVVNAVLAFLLLMALREERKGLALPGLASRAGGLVLAVVVAHGVFDETHQFFTGRTCSVLDILLDAAGALLVLLAPLRGGAHRPRSWRPCLVTIILAVGLATAAWMGRPWPDRVLEEFLQSLVGSGE